MCPSPGGPRVLRGQARPHGRVPRTLSPFLFPRQMRGAAPLPPRGRVAPEGSPDQNPGLRGGADAGAIGTVLRHPPEGGTHPAAPGAPAPRRARTPALSRAHRASGALSPARPHPASAVDGPAPAGLRAPPREPRRPSPPLPRPRPGPRRRPAGKPEAPVLPSPVSARAGRPKPEPGSAKRSAEPRGLNCSGKD